ncbi:MAG: hypothetical protein QG657_3469 [Acidobacteriota bacterium]|nr:hypothetical protein [Acidobacteriota bacterium]
MKKKLKLTKLTIANLDRIKGGNVFCACPDNNPRLAAYDYNVHHTLPTCIVCPTPDI